MQGGHGQRDASAETVAGDVGALDAEKIKKIDEIADHLTANRIPPVASNCARDRAGRTSQGNVFAKESAQRRNTRTTSSRRDRGSTPKARRFRTAGS